MTTPDPTRASELEELAAMVRRLRPDWRDAESFYELRSEIAGKLMRLSREQSGWAMAPRPRAIAPPVPLPSRVMATTPVARATAPTLAQARPIGPLARRWPKRRNRFPHPPRLPADVQACLL